MSDIDEDPTAFFRALRALIAASGKNKDHQVINLIVACIEAGANTEKRITAIGCKLGFKAWHTLSKLNEGNGTSPSRSRWRLTFDGTYALL